MIGLYLLKMRPNRIYVTVAHIWFQKDGATAHTAHHGFIEKSFLVSTLLDLSTDVDIVKTLHTLIYAMGAFRSVQLRLLYLRQESILKKNGHHK